MGVDHANSRNSAPIHVSDDLQNLRDTNLTQLNTKNLKENKRVVFNHESSIN